MLSSRLLIDLLLNNNGGYKLTDDDDGHADTQLAVCSGNATEQDMALYWVSQKLPLLLLLLLLLELMHNRINGT